MSFAFFADSATVPPDGKFYALGGGFSALALPSLPGLASFAVVAGFRFNTADAGKVNIVELRFVDSLAKLVLPPTTMRFESAGPPPTGTAEVSVSTVSVLQPTLGEPGEYAAQFWHEGVLLNSVRLHVLEQQRPANVPAPGGPLPA